MFELTIKDKVYPFRFGLGFVRDIDKTRTEKQANGLTVNVGLNYAVAALLDENAVEVVELLLTANKTEEPRITRKLLDEYIEDESTDFEAICKEILDFFERGNATKKRTAAVMELIEKEEAKAEANQTE